MPGAGTASAPSPKLGPAFAFAAIAFAWWRISENTADNDLWGHVLYGQRMIFLRGLETTETLSWTAFGGPWINHEILAEVALGAAHWLGGSAGLWLLMSGLAAMTIGWSWWLGSGREPMQRLSAAALLVLCTNSIASGYAARPQIFTYLFFVILLTALRRCFAGAIAWSFAPPLLLIVWVNTHGGYLAGWVVLILATTTETIGLMAPSALRRLRCEPVQASGSVMVGIALTSSLALLLNPWGWQLVAWTLETLRLPRPWITEWQPMAFTFASLPFYTVIALGVVSWILSRQPRRLWEILVWALLAFMSVRHARHAPLFGLATLMLLPPHVHDLLRRLAPATTALRAASTRPHVSGALILGLWVAGCACLLASVSGARQHPFRMEVPRDLFPVAAIEFMREQHLTGNTLTFFDWGQQVLWELPDNPVSFDGRLDTVYPAAVMNAHWRLYAGEEPGPALDLTLARVALLPSVSRGVDFLQTRGWAMAYTDPLATVLVRPPVLVKPNQGDLAAVTGRVVFPENPAALARRASRPSP
jgi:hypothetical protein